MFSMWHKFKGTPCTWTQNGTIMNWTPSTSEFSGQRWILQQNFITDHGPLSKIFLAISSSWIVIAKTLSLTHVILASQSSCQAILRMDLTASLFGVLPAIIAPRSLGPYSRFETLSTSSSCSARSSVFVWAIGDRLGLGMVLGWSGMFLC